MPSLSKRFLMAQTEKKQHLIDRVGIRMNRLRKHAARTGQPGSPGLGQRNAGIGKESVKYRPRRGIMC